MRAIAVVAVILFHAWPAWFGAGFVGVDMFFVVSGFLITSIMLRAQQSGHFSIADFYRRRIRRIFPALVLVLACTLAAGWCLLLHAEFLQLGRHALAGSAFVSNLLLWREAGYFDNAGTTKPLLHLWSLGVEEQFDIIWPLLFLLVPAARLPLLAATLFVLSMLTNLVLVRLDPVAAYFSPLSRFWEIMAGALAAHCMAWGGPWPRGFGIAGVLLLLLAFWQITPQTPFPGWWALAPVGGTFLLIMARRGWVHRLLAHRALAGLGLVSYPLYLWHWPLLSFAYITYGQRPPMHVKLAMIGLAFLLALLTWRYVERPLRQRRALPFAGAMAGVAALSVLISTNVLRERIEINGAEPLLAALNDTDFPGPSLQPLRYRGVVFQEMRSQGSGVTVFLGDSIMQQFGPRIEHVIAADPARFHSVVFATAGGCPPIEHTHRLPQLRHPRCASVVRAAYALAAERADVVVIGAAWYGYFNEGQHEVVFDDGMQRAVFPDTLAQDLAYRALQASMARLRGMGKRVYLLLQPPAGAAFNPQTMFTGSRFGAIAPVARVAQFDLAGYRQRHAAARARLVAIAGAAGAHVIEPAEYLCRANLCPVQDASGAPLYTDDVHMRPAYSRRAAGFLDQTIRRR